MRWLDLRSGLVAAALLASPAAAEPVICQLDGVEAVRSAKDRGFTFKVRESNATRCERSQATIIVAAPQARDVICKFQIFGGRVVGEGWRLHDVVIRASEGTEVETARLNKGWLLLISAPRGQTSRVNIKTLFVRGEDCRRSNNAFAGG